MINAAVLARVSRSSQEDNSSLDSQLGRGREHCHKMQYHIVVEKKEVFSGGFVLARSTFNELLAMMADGLIEVIVVDIPDRLGRGDVIAQCELLAKMNGGRIEYAQPGRDVNTIEGIAMKATEQLVSGIERLNIRRRTSGGKVDWAKMGRVIAPPRRPYGYNIVVFRDERGKKTGCTLEIVESEAKVVQQIYEMYTIECLTTKQISKRLSDAGVPRISQYDPIHAATQVAAQKKRNRWTTWPRATISSILGNPMYKGEWQYGRRKVKMLDSVDGIKYEVTRRSPEEVISVSVPAIVSSEQWQLAQIRLKENARKFKRPTDKLYMLRGRMRCALCGGKFYCVSCSRGPRYYVCGRHNYDGVTKQCPAGSIAADRIETIIWNVVCEEMQHPERLLAGARKRRADFTKARRALEQSLVALEILDSKDNEKLGRILDLYAGGHMKKDAYLARKAEIDAILAKRQAERDNILERMTEIPVVEPEFEQVLMAFKNDIADRLHPDVPLVRRIALLDLLIVDCVFNAQTKELNISGLFGNRMLSTSSM